MLRCLQAKPEHIKAAALMGVKLWPDQAYEVLFEDFLRIFDSEKDGLWVAESDGEAVAFLHASLRFDYVEGTDSSPVGYIEAVYVEPGYRRRDVAKTLLAKAEQWAREAGCFEMASDTELWNREAEDFHKSCGFEEQNRLIVFSKKI